MMQPRQNGRSGNVPYTMRGTAPEMRSAAGGSVASTANIRRIVRPCWLLRIAILPRVSLDPRPSGASLCSVATCLDVAMPATMLDLWPRRNSEV
jgi:hypothetical protein